MTFSKRTSRRPKTMNYQVRLACLFFRKISTFFQTLLDGSSICVKYSPVVFASQFCSREFRIYHKATVRLPKILPKQKSFSLHSTKFIGSIPGLTVGWVRISSLIPHSLNFASNHHFYLERCCGMWSPIPPALASGCVPNFFQAIHFTFIRIFNLV